MTPALIKSLLSTMGVNPDHIVKQVEIIAGVAQAIDARLANLEMQVAQIYSLLSETGTENIEVLEFIETGKGKRK